MNKIKTISKSILYKLDPRHFRDLSLAEIVVASVFLSIVVAGGVVGYYARSVIYENKLIDTWAIMFLESENLANRLRSDLLGRVREGDSSKKIVFSWDGQSDKLVNLTNTQDKTLEIKDIGYDDGRQLFADDGQTLKLISVNGSLNIGTIVRGLQGPEKSINLVLQPISRSLIAEYLTGKSKISVTSYVVTKEGKLIYANARNINEVNFVSRPLVQKFISSPLSGGLQEFNSEDKQPQFGFFMEVPDTNLVIFSEAPQAVILNALRDIAKKYLIVLCVIVLLVLVTVALPITRITAPLEELKKVARGIGSGDLSQKALLDGYGEVKELGEAFNQMVDGLNSRDREIKALLVERTEKARLQAELKVAQGIQANLLPQNSLADESGLDVYAEYHPATECAGDWYQYYYNKTGRETIVIVVDVSGHGAGSSMFTALIAGVFDRFCDQETGPWDIAGLMAQINKVIYRFGKGAWHATVLVARHRLDLGVVDLVSAGHTPPFILRAADHGKDDPHRHAVERVRLPSSILGSASELEISHKSVKLTKGDILFLYTDGLTEALGAGDKAMTPRKLRDVLASCHNLPASQALSKVVSEWRKHRNGRPALDDACLVMIRAVA